MKFYLEASEGSYQIRSYNQHSVTVNETIYTHSLILMSEYLSQWAVESFESLTVTHFEQLRMLRPEVVLLGTGPRQRFPPPAVLAPLINEGIGIEVMDTPAACRTYMVLLGDRRTVVAALLFK